MKNKSSLLQCGYVFSLILVCLFSVTNSPDNALAATKCKTGFKLGKTPVSLVVGDAPGCYSVKLAAAAKKLLTGNVARKCITCHAAGTVLFPIAHVANMNTNLRNQGYSLAPDQITAAFNMHVTQMIGSKMSNAEAKQISQFLQSIK